MVCRGGRNIFTENEYADFHLKFDFRLTPGANNGLGIRAPLSGNAAYAGMELQILDNAAKQYANLKPYQYHGSIYGVVPAKRGYLKPAGQWNHQEVIARGSRIKVIEKGTMDHKKHPGLRNQKGHIGFLGHGTEVAFKKIEIREL